MIFVDISILLLQILDSLLDIRVEMLVADCSQLTEVADKVLDVAVADRLLDQQQFFGQLLDVVETENTLLLL